MILTNARLILADAVRLGTLVIENGQLVGVEAGLSHVASASDMEGDFLMPGAIDVHTDNLERQVQPRSNARWPSRSAMIAHDAQCAAAGVTTVLDALCLGDLGFEKGRVTTFHDGVRDLDALADTGLLKSEHFLHLRCELPASDMMELLDPVAAHPRVRMVSLMDHSPGMGQYADLDKYRAMRAREGHTAAWIEARILELQAQRSRMRDPNRQALLSRMRPIGTVLASHDDRTVAEVAENHADGIRISEFPVSLEAAAEARRRGMLSIAGAPNIVRGGSHSGNVSAALLVREGVVDALASDYVPSAMIEAAWAATLHAGISLPQAVHLITAGAAAMVGLPDRGSLMPGQRADVVRVREFEGMPVVRQVWRAGERVI